MPELRQSISEVDRSVSGMPEVEFAGGNSCFNQPRKREERRRKKEGGGGKAADVV